MKRKLIWLLPILCLTVLALWYVIVPLLPSTVTSTKWHLQSVRVVGGSILWTSNDAKQFTIEFGWRTISGRGSCNSYEGGYQLNQFTRSFSTSWTFHTMIGCLGEGAQEQEEDFFHALDTANRYELREGNLHIYFENGAKELVFEPE